MQTKQRDQFKHTIRKEWIILDMKKVRDQARKENNAVKTNAKGKAKAVKEFASNAVDSVVSAKDAVSKKAGEVKTAVVSAAKTAKADTKADVQKAGKIHQDIAAGVSKVVSDAKHTSHDVAEKIKHH